MIYKYIFNNISFDYLIFIIFIIFFIGYCFNQSNFNSKGVLGILIGIIIAWLFIDFYKDKKINKSKSIDSMVKKTHLFKNLDKYHDALFIFNDSYQFGKNNIIDFRKSIDYFVEMMEIYNKIKIIEDKNIFLLNNLQSKYQQCISSFKSLEITIEYFELKKFYILANRLNNLLLKYVDECIELNNKEIDTKGYNIYKKKVYKDPKEYNYDYKYNSNMI